MYSVETFPCVRRACMVEARSVREAFLVFGMHRDHAEVLTYSVQPGYWYQSPPLRLQLAPLTCVIDDMKVEPNEGSNFLTGLSRMLQRERSSLLRS